MKKILLKNVTLTEDCGYGKKPVHVIVKNRKIAEITGTLPEKTDSFEVIDCKGNLLIPAFYNAHCHSAMMLFRGCGEDLPLQRWLNEKILPAEDKLSFRTAYHASMLGIAEMIRNGIASFSDMYMFQDATAEAVLETGIKANLCRCVVSFDPDIDMTTDYRMTEAMRLAEWYHKADEGRILIDFGLHAEYTNVPKACSYIADMAQRLGTGIQIHLSETEKEQRDCIRRWKKTPTEFFRDTGVLNVPTCAAHGVWLTDGDRKILAEKKATLVHNPVSNLKLGSGVMDLKKALDAGINVALGTDGVASNNRLDMFRELQTAALLHKGVNHDPAIIPAKTMYLMSNRNGALAQRRTDCGKIEVGYRADLVLINRDSIHNIPCYDDYAMLCFSADCSDVMMTMVDGRILFRNGEYTSIDEEQVRFEAKKAFSSLF